MKGAGLVYERMQREVRGYPEIDLLLREAGHVFQVQFVKKWEFDFAPDNGRTDSDKY